MLRRALAASRYVVIVAVVSTLLSSMALLLYGAILEIATLFRTLAAASVTSKGGKALALSFIEATDIFLIGIVLFIFSLGLYTLFIDDKLVLPSWLEVKNLDDLKAQLISVVIAALAVIFLGYVVQWEGEGDAEFLGFGAAVALMVAALAFFLNTKPREKH